MGVVGFEPTQPEDNRFTVCPASPTAAHSHAPTTLFYNLPRKRDNPIKEGCDTCTWCGRVINLGLATTLFYDNKENYLEEKNSFKITSSIFTDQVSCTIYHKNTQS